jgi:hypothetical protein
MSYRNALIIGLSILPLINILHPKVAEAQNLPSTEQFHTALTACATNSDIAISSDLLGSVSSIYNGQKTQGNASLKTATKFIDLFPEADRAKIYELYTKCIGQILHLDSGSTSLNNTRSSHGPGAPTDEYIRNPSLAPTQARTNSGDGR